MKLSQNKKKPKTPKRVILTRVMALLLCLLMVGGMFAIVVPYLGARSYAAETDDYGNMSNSNISDTVRVGLMFGSGVTVGFQTKSQYGFNIGYLENNNFYTLWQVTDDNVSVTCDSNLSKNGMTYLKTNSAECAVGGWHVEVSERYDVLDTLGYNVFPAYINNTLVYRIGQFGSQEEAQSAVNNISQHLNASMRIAAPSNTSLSVLNPYDDKILFEFDDSSGKTLGLTAVQNGDVPSYLITPANNYYEGVFEFKRYINGGVDGVTLINVLYLDDYVTGVLPSEIGVSWPLEVQKAFAVTVRTFTASMMSRHMSQYGFDMCNDTHCQMFTGVKRATDLTRQAVRESTDMILTYNDEPARTYYSAVAGGVTASGFEVWGGSDHPYLKAVATPWENYEGHAYGAWTTEVTPKELLNTLVGKGYTSLSGEIADVRINKFAENSSYVYSITFTDTNGKSVTIEKCDTVRTSLTPILKSANFVVARSGETVAVTEFSLGTAIPITRPSNIGGEITQQINSSDIHIMTEDGLITLDLKESISIVKDIGSETVTDVGTLTVLTGDGRTMYDMTKEKYSNETPAENTAGVSQPVINSNSNLPDLSNILSLQLIRTEKSITAEGASGNFVFIGKGWGHGVGMSQYGAMNMAELGYDYQTILKAYFPGTVIERYQ